MNEFHAQKCVTQTKSSRKRDRKRERKRASLRACGSTCSMQLGTNTNTKMNMLWHTFCSWKTFRANLHEHKYV